jgi:putative transposase
VRAHRAEHSIVTMCRVLEVSTSGYYAWRVRPESARRRRDAELSEKIAASHDDSDQIYGAPRVHVDLLEQGERVSGKRVARLMREAGRVGVSRRRRKAVTTTQQQSGARPAPDLVNRAFEASGPDQLWVADITYVRVREGFLYLAVVLDVWSRRIVGWAMADHLRTPLVLDALDMAVAQRLPVEVVHHSDHGCQYTSTAFGARCREAGVRPSLGSVGDCYDNAMCESFFATLECELLDRRPIATRAVTRRMIFEFIEGWYNTRRRHSSLGYLSPVNFERASSAARKEVA